MYLESIKKSIKKAARR